MVFIEAKSMEDVEKAIAEHETIIVDIGSPTCHPCIVFEKKIKMFMEDHPEINVVKADMMQIPEVIDRYNVMGVPVFIVYKNGKIIGDERGYNDDVNAISDIDELILEAWFRVVRAFLMDFKEDIYGFARVGDVIYEAGADGKSKKMLTIRNRIYILEKVWIGEENGTNLNAKIEPRKVGFFKTTMTKWRIAEIKGE